MFTTPSVAVVTGAAKGIGFTIAQTLLESGSSVLVFDLDADAAKGAVDRLSADHGDRVGISVGSVTSSDDLNAAFDTAEAELGPVDVLVNNAGFTGIVPIIDMEEKDWTAVMSVLTTGPFLGTQILARRVIARGGTACVVNTSSVNYRSATEGMAHYCSGKAAVSMFTQVAAAELGRHGIRVNAVAPA
jgi:NAD(P)-dependent dehydrogenase (short-subunit alcohol dehydrogenase family)